MVKSLGSPQLVDRPLESVFLKVSLIFPWLLALASFTTAKGLPILLSSASIWFMLAVIASVWPSARQQVITAMMLVLIGMYAVAVQRNGLQAVMLLPIVAAHPAFLLRGLWRIVCTGAVIGSSFLALTAPVLPEPALFWRAIAGGSLTAVLIMWVTQALESSVRHNQERNSALESMRKAQDELLAIVSHEIRTPAASVHMVIEEAAKTASDAHLAQLHSLSSHLLSVIDDMRLLTSAEEPIARASVTNRANLSDLANECMRELANFAQERDFHLSVSTDGACHQTFEGPFKAIRQIIQNLTRNAILHSGGTRVALNIIHCGHRDGLDHFIARISDDGTGISPHDQTTMFEPFERGRTLSEGTGLGLHVSRELARQLHGGGLYFQPREPQGAVFELTFALSPVADLTSPTASSILDLTGFSILLVEDSPVLRKLTSTRLKGYGAQVVPAADGREALQAAEQHAIDLVLTDIMMPNMDGFELVSTLRALDFKQPIIGLTSATIGQEANRLLACGADCVLSKPLRDNDFAEALRSLSPTRQLPFIEYALERLRS